MEPLRELPVPLSWDAYFLNIAEAVKDRSSCSRRQVGAVIARDHIILSTGYNGTPRGIQNCNAGGCPRCAGNAPSGTDLGECLCVHAEANAIASAARTGARTEDSSLYCTLTPCKDCAKLMINAGVRRVVVASTDYNHEQAEAGRKLLAAADVYFQVGGHPEPIVFGPWEGLRWDHGHLVAHMTGGYRGHTILPR